MTIYVSIQSMRMILLNNSKRKFDLKRLIILNAAEEQGLLTLSPSNVTEAIQYEVNNEHTCRENPRYIGTGDVMNTHLTNLRPSHALPIPSPTGQFGTFACHAILA
jgi:hypothetical protein